MMQAYIGILVDYFLSSEEEQYYEGRIRELTESLEQAGYIAGRPSYDRTRSTVQPGKQIVYSSFTLKKSIYEADIHMQSAWIGLDRYKLVRSLSLIDGGSWCPSVCTCGAHKTYGANCPSEWHYRWCDYLK